MSLTPLTPELRSRLRIGKEVKGLLITALSSDSTAATRGIEPGDVLMEVNQRPANTVADVRTALQEAKKAKREFVLLRIARREVMLYVTVPIK
jgi:serine protease Do